MSTKETRENPENEEFLTANLADEMQEEVASETKATDNETEQTDNLSEELAKMKDSYLRLMAEYDNYRKRTIKEKAELIKNGGEKVLIGFLPIIDDFERALDNIENAKDMKAVKEGVGLIHQKFMSFLSQNGVKPIEIIGKDFDEAYCEAVALVPAQSEDQKSKVIDDVQTGYTLNDKVIRHAKVVVAN